MRKLIDDTLKTNGKYSRKSLTTIVTFILTMTLGTFIVVSGKTTDIHSIEVFKSMLIFLSVLMGLTEASKKLENKNTPPEE